MLRYLTEEPEWETQENVIVILEDGAEYERFTLTDGTYAVFVSMATHPGWYSIKPDYWNHIVDIAKETYGTSLYL